MYRDREQKNPDIYLCNDNILETERPGDFEVWTRRAFILLT